MIKNNKIKQVISNYRKIKSINIFTSNLFSLLTLLLSFSIIFIIMERFVFFSVDTRIRISAFLLLLIISFLALFLIKLFLQISGKSNDFKDSEIAREIGIQNPNISDKLINAFQLKHNQKTSSLSSKLSSRAIKIIDEKISSISMDSYIQPFRSNIFKCLSFLLIILLFINYNVDFANASIRMLTPTKVYEIPKPYEIISIDSNIQLLEGDSLNLSFKIENDNSPDSINIMISEKSHLKEIAVKKNNNGLYEHTLSNIFNDITYWAEYNSNSIFEPWDKIESSRKLITVIKRPRINSIEFQVKPPKYSGLKETLFSANNTDIPMLEGSSIALKAIANKDIKEAWLKNNDNLTNLNVYKNQISDEITIKESSEIVLFCKDYNGINNINPPLNKINVIKDSAPQIFVSNPDFEFSINDNKVIPIDIQILDDYGIGNSWIEYKIKKPIYLSQDSTVYKYELQNLNLKAQRIENEWNLAKHFLGPGDNVEFYIFVSDNNDITGPSTSQAGPFIGKIPSLDDLFEDISNLENDMMEDVEEITLSIDDVYDLVDNLEKDLLKSEDISWEQEQKVAESAEKIDDILGEIEEISEMIQEIQQEADNNELFNQELLNKFNEFQELLDQIITDEMLETLKKLNEQMEQMSNEQMLSEIQNLKQDISMMEEQLDRFIELFQLAMAEQSLDELIKIVEEMLSSQIDISNNLANDETNFNEILKKENNQINSFKNVENKIKQAKNNIEKFSTKSAKSLDEIANSENVKSIKENLQKAANEIAENMRTKSFSTSEKIINDLESLINDINDIKESFNSKMVDEMTVEFINLIKSIEIISFDQELVSKKISEHPSYSPEIPILASKQNIVKNKIIKFIDQLINVSNKTLHIPPGVNGAIGAAQLSIQKSIGLMEQKNIKRDLRNQQEKAINAINETAYILLSSLNQMQSSMSASGMENYLEQLSKMAESQQQINQGSQQCSNPGFMPGGQNQSIQGELMKRLQKQQEALSQQLQEMIGEMPGGQNEGSLSKAAQDMEEVIKDFQRRKITRETIERQNKILSRMLDSQKSLKQKDYNDKRKSESAENIIYDAPLSLPEDKGERQTLLTKALQEALEQEYSDDYQIILKKYFKYLENQDINEN